MKNTLVKNVDSWIFSKCAKDKPKTAYDEKTVYEFLSSKFDGGYNFGTDELLSRGIYKLAGWIFDFRPYMKKFLVKQYDSWREYYAPNKTLLRKSIRGRINKIIEIGESEKI